MTTALGPDAQALCAALDSAPEADVPCLLGLLADALEEAGNALAAGLRQVGDRRPGLSFAGPAGAVIEGASWSPSPRGRKPRHDELPASVYRRLAGGGSHLYEHRKDGKGDRSRLHYPTRSGAYLALAEALAG